MEKQAGKISGNEEFPMSIMSRVAQVKHRWTQLETLMRVRPQHAPQLMFFHVQAMWKSVKGNMQRRHEREWNQFLKSEERFLAVLENRYDITDSSLPHVPEDVLETIEEKIKELEGEEEIDIETVVPEENALAAVEEQLLDEELEGAGCDADSTTVVPSGVLDA